MMKESVIDGRHILVTYCKKARVTTNQIGRCNQMREREAPITVEEVVVAISKLKNGKSPGICGIRVVVKWLHRIMSLAWENGQVPGDWG